MDISWTPEHSNTQGNEYADQMAKEAAEEANEKTELPLIVTMGDVKTAARESGKMKWQEMWGDTEKGSYLFGYRNKDNKVQEVLIWTTNTNQQKGKSQLYN